MALPDDVDHLVYAAPEIEAGRDEIERLLGVRPAPGGRHPAWGTRNALVSLGPATYLEVIAPDPEAPTPSRGVLFGLDRLHVPVLLTWALASASIEASAATATGAGLAVGPIESGGRETTDGGVLSWTLTDPQALPLGGAVPFLIDWGDTPHPAATAPRGGELVGLRVEHPEPARVREALEVLGVEMDVTDGPRYELIAAVRTADGVREIR